MIFQGTTRRCHRNDEAIETLVFARKNSPSGEFRKHPGLHSSNGQISKGYCSDMVIATHFLYQELSRLTPGRRKQKKRREKTKINLHSGLFYTGCSGLDVTCRNPGSDLSPSLYMETCETPRTQHLSLADYSSKTLPQPASCSVAEGGRAIMVPRMPFSTRPQSGIPQGLL